MNSSRCRMSATLAPTAATNLPCTCEQGQRLVYWWFMLGVSARDRVCVNSAPHLRPSVFCHVPHRQRTAAERERYGRLRPWLQMDFLEACYKSHTRLTQRCTLECMCMAIQWRKETRRSKEEGSRRRGTFEL